MWSLIRFLLAIVAVGILTPITALVVILVPYLVYCEVVPAHSASTRLDTLQTTLTLRFYRTEDWNNADSGRYLHVTAPAGRVRIAMTAFDWAHNSRTSVYLTPQRKIAVLGPAGDDYLISLDPPGYQTIAGRRSDDWTYLGAFDYDLNGKDGGFRFVGASEQAECIPMLSDQIGDYLVRRAARRPRCPHFFVQSAGK